VDRLQGGNLFSLSRQLLEGDRAVIAHGQVSPLAMIENLDPLADGLPSGGAG